jgi:hypothetical protein
MRAIWEKQELSDNSRGVIHKPTPSVEKDLPPVKSEDKTDFSRPRVSYLQCISLLAQTHVPRLLACRAAATAPGQSPATLSFLAHDATAFHLPAAMNCPLFEHRRILVEE